MDYSKYRARATVDWIEITITTAAKTQAWRVQKRSGFTHVTGHDQDGQPLSATRANDPTDRFTIRHQDPKNWRDIAAKIARLMTPETATGAAYTLTSCQLAGVEIALDLEDGDATIPELAGVVANLAWFTMSPPHDQARDQTRPEPFNPEAINFRTYRQKREEARRPRDLAALAQRLADGWHVGIGDQHANRYAHGYVKTSDQVQGKRQACKPCARFENRLRGDMLQQLGDDMTALKFASLAPFFKFGQVAPGAAPLAAALAQRYPFPAWRIDDQGERTRDHTRVRDGRRAGTRAMLPGIEPAAELNRRAAKALQNLARSWKAAPRKDLSKRL